MLNLFFADQYGHSISTMRHNAYRYDQAKFKCPYCQTDHHAIPLGYINNEGYRESSNYARCIICHKVIRKFGHSVEEFMIRQWIFTVLTGRPYKYTECRYLTMNTRFPYPPMTRIAVYGTRD